MTSEVVVVDGRDRGNCVVEEPRHLSERGGVIFDDANRKRHRGAFEHLRREGSGRCRWRDTVSRAWIPSRPRSFYRDGTCLGL